jgi:hypothetical protein
MSSNERGREKSENRAIMIMILYHLLSGIYDGFGYVATAPRFFINVIC